MKRLLALLLLAAPAAAKVDRTALLADEPPATLSATGLFGPGGANDPDPEVIPYQLTSPLAGDTWIMPQRSLPGWGRYTTAHGWMKLDRPSGRFKRQ